MPEYLVTSAAGRQIGSERNMGVGTVMQLSEGFADAFVAMGWLVPRVSDVTAPDGPGDGGQTDMASDPQKTGEKAPQSASAGKPKAKAAKAASGPENGA